jgi:hypothetical protein
VNPKATWSFLLESYHPYLLPQKVLKNIKFIAFIVAYPKIQEAFLVSKNNTITHNIDIYIYNSFLFFSFSFVDTNESTPLLQEEKIQPTLLKRSTSILIQRWPIVMQQAHSGAVVGNSLERWNAVGSHTGLRRLLWHEGSLPWQHNPILG